MFYLLGEFGASLRGVSVGWGAEKYIPCIYSTYTRGMDYGAEFLRQDSYTPECSTRHRVLAWSNENIICSTQPDDVLIARAKDETLVG